MTNVVAMPGVDPDLGGEAAEPSVVELLRDWFAMAERGEIVSVALCGTNALRATITAAAGGRASTLDALAAVTVLRLRVEQDYLAEPDQT